MAKSKEELISMIENDLVDPSTNKITGERVKNALTEMVDAMGTGGGGGNWEYWACPPEGKEAIMTLSVFASQVRVEAGASVMVVSAMYANLMTDNVKAMSFDMSCPIISSNTLTTVGDAFAELGADFETIGFTRITKEQFYELEQWS